MEWTKETPTQKGLYWLRAEYKTLTSDWTAPEIVEFNPLTTGGYYLYYIGSEVARGHEESPDNTEWYGPLSPPE